MTIHRDVLAAGERAAQSAKRRVGRAMATYRRPQSRGAVTSVSADNASGAVETGGGNNLVRDPVFVLCSPRSGSTLLRSILDSHSQICAPHELHLRDSEVRAKQRAAANSWQALGFTPSVMEDILWDRILHILMARSGKSVIVDKTPQNVLDWKRIHAHWPHARYVYLRRHPLRIVESRAKARPDQTIEFQIKRTAIYCAKMDQARAVLPGTILRYEDLTADPAREVKRVCAYLGVAWEPAMLEYRQDDYKVGLGDWTDKIRSGRIQPSPPPPPIDDVPVDLRGIAVAWGYG